MAEKKNEWFFSVSSKIRAIEKELRVKKDLILLLTIISMLLNFFLLEFLTSACRVVSIWYRTGHIQSKQQFFSFCSYDQCSVFAMRIKVVVSQQMALIRLLFCSFPSFFFAAISIGVCSHTNVTHQNFSSSTIL